MTHPALPLAATTRPSRRFPAARHLPRAGRPALCRALAAGLLGLAALGPAGADEDRRAALPLPKAYTSECAACHLAYPPGMLPARSWARMMNGLDKHYGTDASLDPTTVAQLSGWLQANAGTSQRVREEPPQDRITQSAWFVRKHREVDASVWKLPSVKSAANCAACHTSAERGSFDDDNLRYPAGMTAAQRARWGD